MKSSSNLVKDDKTGAFVENNCSIEFEGKKFTSGGAWLAIRKDTGKMAGQVYVTSEETSPGCYRYFAQSWDGSIKVNAIVGDIWTSNFGDRRRSVWFRYQGRYFHGVWCSFDWTQLVTVKEVKPWD